MEQKPLRTIKEKPSESIESENLRLIGAAIERLCMENKGMDILDAAKITIKNKPELFKNLKLRKSGEKGKVNSKALNSIVNALYKANSGVTKEEFKSHLISSNLEWFMNEEDIKNATTEDILDAEDTKDE